MSMFESEIEQSHTNIVYRKLIFSVLCESFARQCFSMDSTQRIESDINTNIRIRYTRLSDSRDDFHSNFSWCLAAALNVSWIFLALRYSQLHGKTLDKSILRKRGLWNDWQCCSSDSSNHASTHHWHITF